MNTGTEIRYATDEPITPDQFRDILVRSTLSERRPVDDHDCLAGMVAHGNLLVTAWDADRLVGVSRSVTDFHYACYLSDLAVDRGYQKRGIGRELMRLTQQACGPRCNVILLAAPAARDYYGHVGFERHESAWVLPPERAL